MYFKLKVHVSKAQRVTLSNYEQSQFARTVNVQLINIFYYHSFIILLTTGNDYENGII